MCGNEKESIHLKDKYKWLIINMPRSGILIMKSWCKQSNVDAWVMHINDIGNTTWDVDVFECISYMRSLRNIG